MASILLVDDEENIRKVIKALLSKRGFSDIEQADSGRRALEILAQREIDIVVSDVMMRSIDGLSLFEHLKGRDLVFVILTAFGNADTAVEYLKKGVFDYVAKPYDENEFIDVISAARTESEFAAKRARGISLKDNLLFGTDTTKVLAEKAALAAASGRNILISGETGTGKALMARFLHEMSGRQGAFIKTGLSLNKSADVNDAEKGFFGHDLTGYGKYKPSKVELAADGTLFVEASRMSADQIRLIVSGLGTAKLIAAVVNPDPRIGEEMDAEIIEMPSLMERRDDIPAIASFYMKKYSGSDPEKRTMDFLSAADWPGNIRQLENVIRRATVSEGAVIEKIKAAYAAEKLYGNGGF